jgi:alkylhydroperoxidase family enzyme
MFEFANASIAIRDDIADAFRHVWDRLANAGTWWSGTERVAIAATARAAYQDEPAPDQSVLPQPVRAAAALLGKQPAAVTEELIEAWEADGLDANHYVELVGIVAQVTTVDTFHRAMSLEVEHLPDPLPGEPTRENPGSPARRTRAWVPMVGPPTIPTSLSAVPAEMAALEALHGPMYLSFAEMSDPVIQKGLNRAQMELVAARTSAINECFF